MTFGFGTLVFTFISSLLMYAAFRPYTDSLLYRIVLSVAAIGVLGAIFGPIIRGQGAAMIPVSFAVQAVAAAVWVAVFHFAERAFTGRSSA